MDYILHATVLYACVKLVEFFILIVLVLPRIDRLLDSERKDG